MESKMIYRIEQRSSSEEENLSPEKKKPRSDQISNDSSGLGQIRSDFYQEEEKKNKHKLEQISSDSSQVEEKKNKHKLEQISSDSSQEEEKIKHKLEQISSSSDISQDQEKNKLKISDSSPEEKENKLKLECIHSDLSSGDSDSEDSSDSSDSEDSEDPEATEERETVEALENTRMKNKKKFELPKEKLKTHGWYGIVMASAGDEYSDAEERAEDMLKYYKQVEKSGGFDVDRFPKARVCGMIGPVRVKGSGSLEDEPLLGKLSCAAIDKFNRDHGREYQFNKVIKSTGHSCAGMVYYITFEAKEADSATIFEASVYRMIGGKVEILNIDMKVV